MSLESREAYLKLPGNLPITKIKCAVPSSDLICPAFVPIGNDVPQTHVSTGENQPESGKVTSLPSEKEPDTESSTKKDF